MSHHDGSPGLNVQVKVNLLDEPVLVSRGSTRLTVNMPSDQGPQTITVSVTEPEKRPEKYVKT